jgi:Protein of unknown function (DUF3302)
VESAFGPLDAFAFVVFAVLIFVAVFVVVGLGKLPGDLARKWEHPQAAAINAMSWIGIATGGLLWPVAFIWAFTNPFGARSATLRGVSEPNAAVAGETILRTGEKERSS